MEFGLRMLPTEYAIPLPELAREAEARGFRSIWVPEHTHIPASRETPFPNGGDLPEEYRHSLDPFVALSAAAAATERIEVGVGVCLVVERDPITLAKSVASLDLLSSGRFLFGVGAGWNREEMRNHGTDPAQRFAILRDRVAAMKAIWTNDETEYRGEYVSFDPIWQWPKPVQKPHPPILVGGDRTSILRQVVDFGDEWIPHPGGRTPESLGRRIAELNNLAAEAGRGPIPVSLYGLSVDTDPALLDGYQKLGVRRCIFTLPSAPRDTVLPLVDRAAGLMRDLGADAGVRSV